MGKFDIDKLLNELTDDSPSTPPSPPAPAPQGEGAAKPNTDTTPPPGDGTTELAKAAPDPAGALINKPASVDRGKSADRGSSLDLSAIDADAARQWAGRVLREITGTCEVTARPTKRLIEILEQLEDVPTKLVRAAQSIAGTTPGASIIELLAEQGVDEDALFNAVAQAYRMPYRPFDDEKPVEELFDAVRTQRLTPGYCKERGVLPLGMELGRLVLGVVDPQNAFAIDDVRARAGVRAVGVVVVRPRDLKRVFDTLDVPDEEDVDVESILSDIDEDDVRVEKGESEAVDLEKEAGESPVIRYVNYIIHQAVRDGASDIHIEPGDKALKVRYRVDGILFDAMQPPAKMAAAITSRLKIMANLDISERRVPQDGRIRCVVQGRKLDLRMSTLPTASGLEKTVMRILDTRSIQVSLDDLGFGEDTLTIWKNQIKNPHGIVLVTGPTGSGKTTTLYSSLRQMDKKTLNISTVEDPVEYHLDGVTQTQINDRQGMTFGKALKALLRQDPDVIMLGEIREIETATIAIQASLTGHLVLSTLHTNDAPSAVTRLGNIGVEGFLIGAALNAVLAQRLVRKVCTNCAQPAELTEEMQEYLDMQGLDSSKVMMGKGCDKCRNMGYSGRVGLYELLVVDDHLRDVIARSPNVTEFRRLCCERGMITLRQDGFGKVVRGLTTPQEIMRVTESTI